LLEPLERKQRVGDATNINLKKNKKEKNKKQNKKKQQNTGLQRFEFPSQRTCDGVRKCSC
jgi:hypothetical protein